MGMVLFNFNGDPYTVHSAKLRTLGMSIIPKSFTTQTNGSITRILFTWSWNVFIIQEGEVERSDKHAEIAMNADRYNPAGMCSF